jgi:hypothetical protein
VVDGEDRDLPPLIVDAVGHSILAAAGAVLPGEIQLERLADAARLLSQ